MSNNRIVWEGLDEFRAALRQLPDYLVNEASGIVVSAAKTAEADVYNAYPVGPTGNLSAGLDVIDMAGAGRYGVGAVLRNRAPHAYIFEHGSQTRKTRTGTPNPMPPGHVFIPRVIRHRRAMYERLKGMLTRAGLTVSGDA